VTIDPDGHQSEAQTAPWQRAPPCFEVWADDDERRFLGAFAACLMSGVSLRPGTGYPPTLFNEQGSYAGACDFKMLTVGPGGSVNTDRGIVEYLPDPAINGVIGGYKLKLTPEDGRAPLVMDQTGRIDDGRPGARLP